MFDSLTPGAALPAGPDGATLERWIQELADVDGARITDAEAIDHVNTLERIKSAAAATQARITVAFDRSRRDLEEAQGVAPDKRGRGVAQQVALARQDSPVKGGRHLGLANALVNEMPRTLAALTCGDISEWRATLMVRETATLTREDRGRVDAELGDRLGGMGDRGVEQEARRLAYQLDPTSAVRRARGANADRRVGLRPAPDTMSYLTGFLPVAQGVAAHTALVRHAERLRSEGDPRTKGQIMADTLIERITGQASADHVSIEVDLVITDRTLLGGDDVPAHLQGYGPLPAPVARDLVRDSSGDVWVRRLFSSPTDGSLVTMDGRHRTFSGELRHLLILRDRVCRTPWCDAPIRHLDHPVRFADGGMTSATNGQGLCEACNYAKESPGWQARPGLGTVTTTTPTGHRHTSRPPVLPGMSPPTQQASRLELYFGRLLAS